MRSYFLACFALLWMAINAYSVVPPQSNRSVRPQLLLCRADFLTSTISALKAMVTHDAGTEFNPAGYSWQMTGYGSSYLQVDFQAMDYPIFTYNLSLKAASVQQPPNFAKISISVNGKMAVTGFQLNHSYFRVDNFDITSYMQKGSNEIVISLDADTQSSAAIQNLSVTMGR